VLKDKVFKIYNQESLKNHHTPANSLLEAPNIYKDMKVLGNPMVKNRLVNICSIHLSHFWLMKHLKNLMKTVDVRKNTCSFISFQFFIYPSCLWLLLLSSEESDLMVKQANLNRDDSFLSTHVIIFENIRSFI